MSRAEFAVAMCVYGGDSPDRFRAAVDSVLTQTCPPTEVVLVVDGPVPEDLDREIRACEDDPLFRTVRLAVNSGHGIARAASIAHTRCELVALMDADDISAPCRFEKQLAAFADDGEADIVGGMIDEFVTVPTEPIAVREVPLTDAEIKRELRRRCPMNQVTVMFKKSAVTDVGGYLDWYSNEDYYLWIRMALAEKRFANVPDVLVHVRVGEEMYRRRGGWRYFRSEAKLQGYMLRRRVISLPIYLCNVGKRAIVQVLLPNRVRGWVFQKFARRSVK